MEDSVNQQERALDGWDIEAGLPLPYMNWATVFVKHYEWDHGVKKKEMMHSSELMCP